MKKMKLAALLLAGTLVCGMMPAAAFAEEGDTGLLSVFSEEPSDTGATETPTEQPPETPAEPDGATETPPETPAEPGGTAETPPETPTEPGGTTETPPETPAEPDGTTETPPGTPAEPTGTPEATPGVTETPAEPSAAPEAPLASIQSSPSVLLPDGTTPLSGGEDGTETNPVTTFEGLKAVLAAGGQGKTISIDAPEDGSSLTFTETLTVAGKVTIIAADAVIFGCADSFGQSFFSVTDTGELTLKTDTAAADSSLTLEGSGSASEAMIKVAEGGAFLMENGVTLSGSKNTAGAGAIEAGGAVMLNGGEIRDNQSLTGAVAVSGNGTLTIGGAVKISGNCLADAQEEEARNVYLAEGKQILFGAAGAELGLTLEKAAAGTVAAALTSDAQTQGLTLKDCLTGVTYDDSDAFSIGENGALEEVTQAAADVGYVEDSIRWNSHDSVTLKLKTTVDGVCYYLIKTEPDGTDLTDHEEIKSSGSSQNVSAETPFEISCSDLTEEKDYILYAYVVEDAAQTGSSIRSVNLVDSAAAGSERPAKGGSSHTPVIPDVKESVIEGLEEPLDLEPGETYDFEVTGAGSENASPGEGDVRYEFRYWSRSEQPSTSEVNMDTKLTVTKEYQASEPYDMYIFLEKIVYTNGKWTPSGEIAHIHTTFSFKEPEEPERTPLVPKVSDSIVYGLEEPLELLPGYVHPFIVVGAGEENDSPGEGDVKYKYRYWSMYANPNDSQKQWKKSITVSAPITYAQTWDMYIFFEKFVYSEEQRWISAGTIERAHYTFESMETTYTPSPTGGLPGTGDDMSGGTMTATGDTTTSDSKTAVSTGDETPLTAALILLTASAATAGVVLTKKKQRR